MSVLEIHDAIQSEADSRSETSADTRNISKMSIGEWFRQGDVYVEKSRKADLTEYTKATTDLQVAFGTTKGSRHILRDNPTLKVFLKETPGPLDGPMFTSTQPIVLEHPEHANFAFPAGTYVVELQQDFAKEEIARAKD